VDDFWLPNLNNDVFDAAVYQNSLALEGYVDAIFVGQGTGLHSDLEDDVARELVKQTISVLVHCALFSFKTSNTLKASLSSQTSLIS
jgi:hypothetical protein